jgi:putative membrane protein
VNDESARSRPSAANALEPAGAVQQRLAYDRTYLANERTYAAWLRTGLAVSAGGIAIAHLVPEPSTRSVFALALGAAFVLLGVSVMTYGAWQFVVIARKIAEETGRPVGGTPRFAFFLTLIIAALLLAVLLFLWLQQPAPFTSP